MGQEAIKLELLEWLAALKDSGTLSYLKVVKDSIVEDSDGWDTLPEAQNEGNERRLKDAAEGKTISQNEMKKKYGL